MYNQQEKITDSTNLKTQDLQIKGFAWTGFVLTHDDGRKCIVDGGKIRRFLDKDGKSFDLMMNQKSI